MSPSRRFRAAVRGARRLPLALALIFLHTALHAALPQSINFPAPADRTFSTDPEANTFWLSASAGGLLTVQFAVRSGPAFISGDRITVTGPGFVTVMATQSGGLGYGGSYNPAEPVERIFAVLPATPSDPKTLLGAWTQYSTYDFDYTHGMLVFREDQSYLFGVVNFDDEDTTGGAEAGTYRWEPSTGAFIAKPLFDDNDQAGFSNLQTPALLIVMDDELQIRTGDRILRFERARSATDPLPGAWRFAFSADTESVVVLSPYDSYACFEIEGGPIPARVGFEMGGHYLAEYGTTRFWKSFSRDVRHGLGDLPWGIHLESDESTLALSLGPTVAGSRIDAANTDHRQRITFSPLANRLATSAPIKLSATASSGLPVEFDLISGPALLSDGYLYLDGVPGLVVVRASQLGGSRLGTSYAPADFVEREFLVLETAPVLAQSISFSPPTSVTYGDASLQLTATASSSLPVRLELVSTSPAGCASLHGKRLHIHAAGKAVIRASQPGDDSCKPAPMITRTVVINKAPLSVHIAPAARTVGQANPTFTLSYQGFVGDDTPASLAPSLPTGFSPAKSGSPPGDYAIHLRGGSDPNYRFVLAEPGTLRVHGFGGAYEMLLLNEDSVPVGKLALRIPPASLHFTGTLQLAQFPGPLPVAGELFPLTLTQAFATAWHRSKPFLQPVIEIHNNRLRLLWFSPEREPLITSETVERLFVQTVENRRLLPSPWTGAHTLVLRDPAPIDENDDRALPLGAGHASVSIAATGAMSLRGRLADGSPFTSSAIADADGSFRVFARPYGKRTDSALAGQLALVAHPDQARFPGRHLVPAETGRLFWFKTPATSDKSYRAGFALEAVATLDPWLAPAARDTVSNGVTIPAGTLAQRLDLADSAATTAQLVLDFLLPAGRDFGARADLLPETLNLSPAGAFSVAEPTTPASANPTAFSLKVTPATGAFTGGFTLSDQVNSPPARPVTRKVTFSGTLRQGPEGRDDTLGHGHFLLSPLPGAGSTEQISGEVSLMRNAPE